MLQTRPSSDDLSKDQDIAFGHLNNKVLGIYKFKAVKPAAAIYSNVDELSIWTMLLMNDGVYKGLRIISRASLTRIMEPHTILGASNMQKQHGINFTCMAWDGLYMIIMAKKLLNMMEVCLDILVK